MHEAFSIPCRRTRKVIDHDRIGAQLPRNVECVLLRLHGRKDLAGFRERRRECRERKEVVRNAGVAIQQRHCQRHRLRAAQPGEQGASGSI